MNDTNTLPLIQHFLTYLTDERHFSPYTGRCYGLDLRQFVEFIERNQARNAAGDLLWQQDGAPLI